MPLLGEATKTFAIKTSNCPALVSIRHKLDDVNATEAALDFLGSPGFYFSGADLDTGTENGRIYPSP